MKKIFILLFFGIFLVGTLINFSSAEVQTLGTFQQNKCVTLIQTCQNCTFVNVSSVTYPNSTFALLGEFNMTKNGIVYNLPFCQTNVTGDYIYTTHGNLNGIDTSSSVSFEITYSGTKLNTSQSIIYVGLIIVMLFLFVITLFGINKLPGKNARDEEGKLVSISWLKYLRSILWFFEWLFVVAILFLTSNIAFSYLGEQLFAKILFTLFRIVFALTLPIVIFWFVWIFVNAFQDKKLMKMMERGVFGGR